LTCVAACFSASRANRLLSIFDSLISISDAFGVVHFVFAHHRGTKPLALTSRSQDMCKVIADQTH
jgi:hypothetical protein